MIEGMNLLIDMMDESSRLAIIGYGDNAEKYSDLEFMTSNNK